MPVLTPSELQRRSAAVLANLEDISTRKPNTDLAYLALCCQMQIEMIMRQDMLLNRMIEVLERLTAKALK